jgi:hypothetical protein
MMAERLNVPEAVIEAQTAHAVSDSLARAYNAQDEIGGSTARNVAKVGTV